MRLSVSEHPDGTALIAVEDSGIGLSPENIDRVFEEFFQVRNHLQNRRRGTGLGLPYSLARSIETLGGTLTASSGSAPGARSGYNSPLARPGNFCLPNDYMNRSSSRRRCHAWRDRPQSSSSTTTKGFCVIVTQMLAPFADSLLEADTGAAGLTSSAPQRHRHRSARLPPAGHFRHRSVGVHQDRSPMARPARCRHHRREHRRGSPTANQRRGLQSSPNGTSPSRLC